MSAFKFTEAEKDELRDHLNCCLYLGHDDQPQIGTHSIFDRIEQIISARGESIQPAPSDQGDAEAVLMSVIGMPNFIGSPPIVSFEHALTAMRQFASIEVAPLRAEVERLKGELANNPRADISIADLRKVFAHRASRITEELNQGANQLMTLSDFRTAVADMGWRIGFDHIEELYKQLTEANQRVAELEKDKQCTCEIAGWDGDVPYVTTMCDYCKSTI